MALVLHAVFTGQLEGPPRNSDGFDYDAIAVGLVRGDGFALAATDEEFRRPYVESGRDDELPTRPNAVSTAKRPPLYPLISAAHNSLFGRQFWSQRLLSCAAVAASVGFVAAIVQACVGALPAFVIVPGLMIGFDWRTREMSRSLLTEPFAALLITLVALSLIRVYERPSFRNIFWLSGAFGVACLTRTMFVGWLAGLLPVLALAVWPQGLKRASIKVGFAVVVIGSVMAPWAVRNSMLAGRFVPIGTQGSIELPAGFSDEAWRRGGVWFNQHERGDYDPILSSGRKGFSLEIAMADDGKERFLQWVAENPMRAILLMPRKVLAETLYGGMGDVAILLLAIFGGIFLRGQTLTVVATGLTFGCFLTVGITWSVLGRFLWPILPVWHALAAIGFWAAVVAVVDLRPLLAERTLFSTTVEENTSAP